MKTKTILYLLLFSLPTLGQGVHLQEIPFDEALRQASEQDKLVFVDFYTGWCMPCAEMAKRLETRPEAAEFFNPRFVTVKFDLEHGEGKILRDRFNITGIPTYALFAPDGSELYRRVGALPLDAFIEKIRLGMTPGNAIAALEEEYASGSMAKERVMDYVSILVEGGHVERSVEVAAALFSTLSEREKLSPRYWPAFRDRHITPTFSDNFRFLLDHLADFRATVDGKELDRKIEENFFILNGFLANHVEPGRLSLLDSVATLVHAYDLPNKEQLEDKAALARAQYTGDVEGIVTLLERLFVGDRAPSWFWQCQNALELAAARGDASSCQRLLSLADRVTAAATGPRKELMERLFQAARRHPL
jgi:thiol-disulfide isomerase/thioredoxin